MITKDDIAICSYCKEDNGLFNERGNHPECELAQAQRKVRLAAKSVLAQWMTEPNPYVLFGLTNWTDRMDTLMGELEKALKELADVEKQCKETEVENA